MGTLNRQVELLRHDVQVLADGGVATATDVQAVCNAVALLVLKCLSDESHPISSQLLALQERIKAEKAGTLYRPVQSEAGLDGRRKSRRKLLPERHFFMPHPGSSDSEGRRYWKLQLLLHTATRSSVHGTSLANRLEMEREAMMEAAKVGASYSINLLGGSQVPSQLLHAIDVLEFVEPDLPFVPDGRYVNVGNRRFRLSTQEAVLLAALIKQLGKPVTHRQLEAAGITYPAQCKSRLLKKFESAGVHLAIDTRVKSYVLHSASA